MLGRLLIIAVLAVVYAVANSLGFGETTVVSQSTLGAVGNGVPKAIAVSGNGRFVAFSSFADNLVPGDTNGTFDVFVRDLLLGSTERVSLSSSGVQGNDASGLELSHPDWKSVAISFDGSVVAFESYASNLVAGDSNGKKDVFIRNRVSGVTQRVSVSTTGNECNVECVRPSLRSDGAIVTFSSEANNLVPGDTNNSRDIFVRDISAGVTTMVSKSTSGMQGNAYSDFPDISGDGRYIVFQSAAANLVTGDTNGRDDIFVHDRVTGVTERCSVSGLGAESNHDSFQPKISSDGSTVCFTTRATNIVEPDLNGTLMDVVARDKFSGLVERVSESSYGVQSIDDSYDCSVSGDGRYVAFTSMAQNLIPNHPHSNRDIYRYDRQTGVTRQLSVSSAGIQANSWCHGTALSGDGRVISLLSTANNLSAQSTIFETQAYANDSTRLIEPIGLTILRGAVTAGGFPSITVSDDDRLMLRPGPVFSTSQQPIQLAVDAVSPSNSISSLTMGLEFNCSSANVVQTAELFNFKSEIYELVDTRSATTTDSLVEIDISTNPSRFIGPNGELRARIGYKAVGPVFSYPWQARLDVVYWTFEN